MQLKSLLEKMISGIESLLKYMGVHGQIFKMFKNIKYLKVKKLIYI